MQVRLFYDDYFSDLRSYDDSTYSSQDLRSSFTSIYRDETLGGSAFFSFRPVPSHEMKTAVHIIHDHHREYNIHPVEEQVRDFRDLTLSGGLEDLIILGERVELELGAGIDSRINLQADNYDLQADSIFPFPEHRDVALNLRAGLLYRTGAKSTFSANLSRKNRFPTMKDRYSYRLGRSVPNPDLQAESSWNASLGYAFCFIYLPSETCHFLQSPGEYHTGSIRHRP
jgi:iron complex outermembrane recepter protein